eukprot:705453-Rhodomonas_salina.1
MALSTTTIVGNPGEWYKLRGIPSIVRYRRPRTNICRFVRMFTYPIDQPEDSRNVGFRSILTNLVTGRIVFFLDVPKQPQNNRYEPTAELANTNSKTL